MRPPQMTHTKSITYMCFDADDEWITEVRMIHAMVTIEKEMHGIQVMVDSVGEPTCYYLDYIMYIPEEDQDEQGWWDSIFLTYMEDKGLEAIW